jgi:hypothetical protein
VELNTSMRHERHVPKAPSGRQGSQARSMLPHGVAEPLSHFTEQDAARLADGLIGARRHASPQSRDLYTAAIHHLGYRFDEHGHLHKVRDADFSAAMKNPAFRAYVAVEHNRVTSQAVSGPFVVRASRGLIGGDRGFALNSVRGLTGP